MKMKTLSFYILSVAVILFFLTGCTIQSEKTKASSIASKTSNATNITSSVSTITSSNKRNDSKSTTLSIHYPDGVGYIWNYDVTIKSYYNGKQISETTYSVETNPQGKEIHFPGKLFQDGSSRTLIINRNGQTTLYNDSTKRYEEFPQKKELSNAFPKTFQSFQPRSPSSQGFTLERLIDNQDALYVKNKGKLKYEMVVNPQNNVAKRISVYQGGNLLTNETVETEQREGIFLPKEVTITQKPANLANSNTKVVTYVDYNTTEFKKVPLRPYSKGEK